MRNRTRNQGPSGVYPGLTVRRDGDAVVVHVPMRIYRRKGRNTMLTPDGQHVGRSRHADTPLVQAVAKAYCWQEKWESGDYAELGDLAKDLGMDRSYLRRTLELTSLAPEIIEAILNGNEPAGLSLATLREGIPERWEEQKGTWSEAADFGCRPASEAELK